MADSVLKAENLTPSDTDIAAANLLHHCCSNVYNKQNIFKPSVLM